MLKKLYKIHKIVIGKKNCGCHFGIIHKIKFVKITRMLRKFGIELLLVHYISPINGLVMD